MSLFDHFIVSVFTAVAIVCLVTDADPALVMGNIILAMLVVRTA